MIKIRDGVELLAYVKGMIDRIAGLDAVSYVDSGIEVRSHVNSYYNNGPNDTKDCVLFLSFFDIEQDMDAAASSMLYTGSMSVLKVAASKKTEDILAARTAAAKVLGNVFGLMEMDSDGNKMEDYANWWELRREDKRLSPTGELGNANAWGYIASFEVWVEAGAIIYKSTP
jgi:hypothetical protein